LESSTRELRAPRALPDDEDQLLTFDELVGKYEKKIFNLILRQVGDREGAADLTQDTFVNKNRFRYRDRRRDVEALSLDAPVSGEEDANPLEIADWNQSPQKVLEAKELSRLIHQAIHALPPEYRAVLVLCDLQGHGYQEIATITGLSLEAVKTRIHRGRLMIRRKLSPYLRI